MFKLYTQYNLYINKIQLHIYQSHTIQT